MPEFRHADDQITRYAEGVTSNGARVLDSLNQIAEIFLANPIIGFLIAPAILTLIAYGVFRVRDELSQHALQNTAATIVVVGLNYAAILAFSDDINWAAQTAYQSLGIPTLSPEVWAATPLWLVCIVGFVAKDFADYWAHRIMHTTWGWPAHAAHHSDTHVNAFTTFRVHYFESLVMTFTYIVMLTWLQMPQALPFVIMMAYLHNLYVHMNLPWAHGPFKLLLASPAFHRWHHADVPAAYGKNLANAIPAWDALFGTYYYPGVCTDVMGAKLTGIEDKNPILIFIYPFQEWGRLIRQMFVRKPQTPVDLEPRLQRSEQ
jgi:sterol desaturase/sphingolipid hydroxylase (fatty acid hydroxylase superfamily)